MKPVTMGTLMRIDVAVQKTSELQAEGRIQASSPFEVRLYAIDR
jgi:hypothetical protein